MVRERRARRPKQATPIWDTPRIKEILSQPVGTPVELTREEALAILQYHLDHRRGYDPEQADRAIAEWREIRKESGAILNRPARDG